MLLTALVKTVTRMYVRLSVLGFLQRKTMYSFFYKSKSQPPRRLMQEDGSVSGEKKIIGNCIIKLRGLGNMKGNLMDPAIYTIWELFWLKRIICI